MAIIGHIIGLVHLYPETCALPFASTCKRSSTLTLNTCKTPSSKHCYFCSTVFVLKTALYSYWSSKMLYTSLNRIQRQANRNERHILLFVCYERCGGGVKLVMEKKGESSCYKCWVGIKLIRCDKLRASEPRKLQYAFCVFLYHIHSDFTHQGVGHLWWVHAQKMFTHALQKSCCLYSYACIVGRGIVMGYCRIKAHPSPDQLLVTGEVRVSGGM